MKKVIIPAAMTLAFVAGGITTSTIASAQNRGPDIEDFIRGITGRTTNSTLGCNVTRNIDRNGDIRYLRLDCRAYGRR